jgi:membrane protein implicated in regulation of membrane protease activity
METKRTLRDWVWRQNALLFFQHDIAVPAGRLRVEGESWRVEAVERQNVETSERWNVSTRK